MATPIAPAGLPTRAPVAPGRRGRWRAAGLLAAAVVAWHAWLVGQLGPPASRIGLPPAGPVQLRTVAPPPVPLLAPGPVPGPAAAPMSPAPAVVPAAPPAAAADPAVPGAAPGPDAAPPPGASPGAGAGPRNGGERGAADADANAEADADAAALPEGQPPPVYATRLPAPARLHYGLRINGQVGVAQLDWQHDGQRYRLTLDGWRAGGQALWMQASDGVLDAHGLAPERFVDRRAGGRLQAANLVRPPGLPTGQIRYSGPSVLHPAWPGAQDRLSWLVQLVAVLAAAEAPPTELQLFVTDARGHAGLWRLQRQPDEQAATPWGDLLQQRWRRDPPRPEGLQIDLWLPSVPDGPAGAWPLRLRMAVPRSGHVVELWRVSAP